MSPGAIREALSRLSAEKWTVATAQKGYSVTTVSIEELGDLTRTRIAIEQMCLRSAIARGDVEWETSIVAAYHRLHRIPIVVAGTATRLNAAGSPPIRHFTPHSPAAATARGCSICAECYTPKASAIAIFVRPGERKSGCRCGDKAIFKACLARDAEFACR